MRRLFELWKHGIESHRSDPLLCRFCEIAFPGSRNEITPKSLRVILEILWSLTLPRPEKRLARNRRHPLSESGDTMRGRIAGMRELSSADVSPKLSSVGCRHRRFLPTKEAIKTVPADFGIAAVRSSEASTEAKCQEIDQLIGQILFLVDLLRPIKTIEI